jgi:DNA-binding winged helix-turn-helix (wHTH) protein/Tfp pilus assembly protein PilF
MTDATHRDRTANAPIQLAREPAFDLGLVEVRPATREVIGPRGRQVIEPRVMQVLVALAQAKGEVLTRDDLTARCWDGRIVGEDAISRVISHLRRLSEGLGRDGWTLETVTKVGYRLLPASSESGASGVVADRPATRPDRRALFAGVAAVTGAGAVWWLWGRPKVSRKARVLYEQGRAALGIGLPESTDQALGFLREALAEEPDFAQAWGALALAYQASLLYTEPPRQAGVTAQAEAAAKRALALDPNEAQASAALALLAPAWRNWTNAERLYKRALELSPGNVKIQFVYARLLGGVGRWKASVERAQAAVKGDEFAMWHRHTLVLCLWAAGRIDEADLAVAKALARWPRHYALWFAQLFLLTYSGRADRAVAFGDDMANRPLNIPTADIEVVVSAARALATRAPKDIEAALAANLTAAKRGPGYAENALNFAASIGRVDQAFQIARAIYFDEGFDMSERRFSTPRFTVAGRRQTHFLFMPPATAMWSDPRFPALTRDLGLGAYWQESGHPPDNPAWAARA